MRFHKPENGPRVSGEVNSIVTNATGAVISGYGTVRTDLTAPVPEDSGRDEAGAFVEQGAVIEVFQHKLMEGGLMFYPKPQQPNLLTNIMYLDQTYEFSLH